MSKQNAAIQVLVGYAEIRLRALENGHVDGVLTSDEHDELEETKRAIRHIRNGWHLKVNRATEPHKPKPGEFYRVWFSCGEVIKTPFTKQVSAERFAEFIAKHIRNTTTVDLQDFDYVVLDPSGNYVRSINPDLVKKVFEDTYGPPWVP